MNATDEISPLSGFSDLHFVCNECERGGDVVAERDGRAQGPLDEHAAASFPSGRTAGRPPRADCALESAEPELVRG